MSIFSNFLKLFKYDSIADSSKTFNIETALNNNWDKVDNFAKDVSQEMEQKADKSKTESLDENDFIAVANNTDFNTLTTPGVYTWLNASTFVNVPTNIPIFGKMKVSDVIKNNTSCLQEIIGYDSSTKKNVKISRAKMNDSGYSWGEWVTEATIDKIDNLF
ncbi:MAG TPA: hypothetical protein DC000_10010, partial [Clostridiales bacterium]|nr:hypothetical protein [Clostridiales bacterium]